MGIYSIQCFICQETFMCFSGNSRDQCCEKCKNKRLGEKMTTEQDLINSLKDTVSVQKELIEKLKNEILDLKKNNIYIGTYPQTNTIPQNANIIYDFTGGVTCGNIDSAILNQKSGNLTLHNPVK